MDGIKNIDKWRSYRLAFERISKAMGADSPIEAVAIEESIISDRLESLIRVLDGHRFKSNGVLHDIRRLRNEYQYSDRILKRIEIWVQKRNTVVHGIVIVARRTGDNALFGAETFIKKAAKIAKDGREIVRDMDKWVRSETRKAKKIERDNV